MSADVASRVALRPMRWPDLAAVAALEAELFADDPWDLPSWWAELAERPRRDYLLLEDEAGLLGYAGLDHGGATSDVMTLAVHPRGRGRGHGRRLLAELLDRARAVGAERVLLEVRADNAAAVGLYEGAGFTLVSTRRRYYRDGVDALVLARDLTADPHPADPRAQPAHDEGTPT